MGVVIAGALSSICVVLALPGSAAEVRLRSSAVCSATIVRLADVAEIHGDDPVLAAALSEVPLCAAPAKGSERQFTQDDVRQLLALSGAEPASVLVTGSETVTVLTETIASPALGSRRLSAKVRTNRQAAFEVDLTSGPGQPARAVIKPAAAIADTHKPLRLVERGALCTVHARKAGIRVTTQGKALQAGALGETIGIEIEDTKERILGRITGSQIVEVAVGGAVIVESHREPATALLPVPATVAR